MELYNRYEHPLILLKYHISQINTLLLFVYNLTEYKICNYIKTCIERIICKQNYTHLISIIQAKTYNDNILFMKNKYNPNIQQQITSEIYKYNLNYKVLFEMINTIQYSKTPIDKLSCITTVVKQINLELTNLNADDLLDIMAYIIINSNIDNPYDEIIYMDEYFTDNINLDAYTLVCFNAVIDYIKSL